MNTKLLEGYIGYTTYYKSGGVFMEPRNVIKLYSGKWWKPNKTLTYNMSFYGDYYRTSPAYIYALRVLRGYFYEK